MKKVILIFILFKASLLNYGQIIADHSIIGDFEKIPAYYIAEAKKMMVCFAGESHSQGYRDGMKLLEALYPAYTANVSTGEAFTDQYVRVNISTSTGEANWFTWYAYPTASRPAAKDIIKNYIAEYATHGHPLSVFGFAWCYDMTYYGAQSGIADPVYGCQWWGWSVGGPDGDRCWGLDAADYSVTGNAVCLDTYLSATQDYIAYCTANGYSTKVVFTTGTVDEFPQEWGYQGYLKNERIRNYVKEDGARILFDYADILCYDNDGTLSTRTWNGHTYPYSTTKNIGDKSIGHIGPEGSIRLAKAQWWMLARIAGWDGGNSSIPVTDITVMGAGGVNTITSDNGTLQLIAGVLPTNASNKTVTWSISNDEGEALINSTGLVTAISNGIVTARATANDGTGVYSTMVISISNQIITGINDKEAEKSTKVTINKNEIRIQLIDYTLFTNISLYSLQGCLITSNNVDSNMCVINISNLPAGMYFVILSESDNFKVIKLIKPW